MSYMIGGLGLAMGEFETSMILLPAHVIFSIVTDNPWDEKIPNYKLGIKI